ncbi:Pea2 protein [Martiniozyma asiatica (nom. inval.)]|nr:Pea2 protein [Martiniozyma asiatica]
MSLVLQLLEKNSHLASQPTHICSSTSEQEIVNFLQFQIHEDQQTFIDSKSKKDELQEINMLTSGFFENLKQKAHSSTFVNSAQTKIVDPVELNILIERSLLIHDLKTAEKDLETTTLLSVEQLDDFFGTCSENTLSILSHYVNSLKIGYVHEIPLVSKKINGAQHHLEELVSFVISLSVQQGVDLPAPNIEAMKTMQGRVEWCRDCIVALMQNKKFDGYKISDSRNLSAMDISTTEIDDIDSVKTAFKDLKFAHKFLTKKYQEELAQHGLTTQELMNKFNHSQALLERSNTQLVKLTNDLLKAEMERKELQDKIDGKSKELHEAQLVNNKLKVDYLGFIPAGQLLSPTSNSSDFGNNNLTSPESATSTSATSPSASILRLEFKKFVEQMSRKFESELDAERSERKRLEQLVAGLRNQQRPQLGEISE